MAGKAEREADLKRWPQYERLYKAAIAEMIEKQKAKGKSFHHAFDDADVLFDWWMERTPISPDKNQISMEDEE
jgi:hypothetical protein